MLKIDFTAEVLPIRVLNPCPDQILIRAAKCVRRYISPAIKRGEVVGRPVREGKNSAQRVSNIGQ